MTGAQQQMYFESEEIVADLEQCISAGSRLCSRPYDMEEFPLSSWNDFEAWERNNV